jgi:hypothetical protein
MVMEKPEKNDQIRDISSIYDCMIDQAIRDVQNAFAIGDANHELLMLRKLAIISAKPEIIEEGEKFLKEYDRELELLKAETGLTEADRIMLNQKLIRWRHEKHLEFLKKIMLTLDAHDAFKHSRGYGNLDANKEVEKF